jgi:hypothetical protein
MKKLITILLCIGLIACNDKSSVPIIKNEYTVYKGGAPLDILIIDSCEYLQGTILSTEVLTHKGNCKNPIHPENKIK